MARAETGEKIRPSNTFVFKLVVYFHIISLIDIMCVIVALLIASNLNNVREIRII